MAGARETLAPDTVRGLSSGKGFMFRPERVRPGDFVYLDPPYVPLSPRASFTSYTAGAFGDRDQRDLAAVYRALDRAGCRLMLSNSDTPLVRDLYAAYRIERVTARRAINSNPNAGAAISELVVVNY